MPQAELKFATNRGEGYLSSTVGKQKERFRQERRAAAESQQESQLLPLMATMAREHGVSKGGVEQYEKMLEQARNQLVRVTNPAPPTTPARLA